MNNLMCMPSQFKGLALLAKTFIMGGATLQHSCYKTRVGNEMIYLSLSGLRSNYQGKEVEYT